MREYQRAIADSVMREACPSAKSACAVVLVATERGKQWVACADERAAAKGVCVGMSLAHARALLKGTPVWEKPFTPVEDARRLRRLARWAQRFSPVVAADEPDGLLLDMAGCEELFGSDERMVALVETSLARWKLPARLALAPTVGCAWAVSRFSADRIKIVARERIREELAPLSVAGLRIDPTFVSALNEVGIERIGSLFDVPRAELACRFGADLLRRLDQATGCANETITPIRTATPIEAIRAFDGPVTSLEAITVTVRELLFALVLQLEERACGVRTLDMVWERISAEPARVSMMLTYPSSDAQHLWSLLKAKIERIHMGYGVEAITLRASRFGPLSTRQMGFDHGGKGKSHPREADCGELLDRLMDRLGPRAVCALTAAETYVPEEAFPLCAWSPNQGQVAPPANIDPTVSRDHAPRPSQLFDVPEPVRVMSLVPEGPPSWVHWRGRDSPVHCAGGPERIALPWWRSIGSTSSSPDLARDYYEVEDDQGRWLWVFQDRATRNWFVQGLWA